MMDREAIETRLAELQKTLEQVQANGNAILGAIQECKYWLDWLDKQEAEPEEPTEE